MSSAEPSALATRTLFEGERASSQRMPIFRLTVEGDSGKPPPPFTKPVIRVGSREGNDLLIDDPAVSRIHFEICSDDHGFRLRDLGSTNGTEVDGYRTTDIYLKANSQIRVGETALRFELQDGEAEVPLSEEESFGPVLGSSPAMRKLFATLQRVAATNFTVLVEGETGTGKELIARAVHTASTRATQPLVVFDAAAVAKHLIESHLFGHEEGAFTGATSARTGVLEEAHGGTLFIDELGELPLDLQPKLLRALEQREICPIGSHETRSLDLRVVAATNRDLAEEVNNGSFRDDLYYRLAVIRLVVPPLRERLQDIRPLVEHFVRLATKDKERSRTIIEGMDDATWKRLLGHHWPGNVRQLRNVVECAVALAGDEQPEFELGTTLLPTSGGSGSAEPDLDLPYSAQRDRLMVNFERDYLLGMLERHDDNITQAADAAGLDRAYFKRLLKKHR